MRKLEGPEWLNSRQKRWMDLTLAAGAAIPAGLIAAAGMAAVGITDREDPVFSHQRIGKDGKPFTMYKIRTLPSVTPAYRTSDEGWSRGVRDARATRIGGLLRRSHFDEIPQLVNIAKGDMGFCGVRPLVQVDIDYVRRLLSPDKYSKWYDAYTAGPPGYMYSIQILDRIGEGYDPEEYFKLKAEHDIADVGQASLEYDLSIMGAMAQLAVVKTAGRLLPPEQVEKFGLADFRIVTAGMDRTAA